MPPKSRKAAPQSAQSHAADQLVAPLSIIECVKRMLSRPPLKAQSSEIVDCLRRIDLADADIQLERVLSRQIARLADQDGDHDADVKEFLLFRMCSKLMQQPMSMASFCLTFGECKVPTKRF
jgi:hypothetical protein